MIKNPAGLECGLQVRQDFLGASIFAFIRIVCS